MSRVTCHVSNVTCHMSRVTCPIFFFFFFFGKSGGASRWRVCYQRGLPRLVLNWTQWLQILVFSAAVEITEPCVSKKSSYTLESI